MAVCRSRIVEGPCSGYQGAGDKLLVENESLVIPSRNIAVAKNGSERLTVSEQDGIGAASTDIERNILLGRSCRECRECLRIHSEGIGVGV